ncbi:hypothetical protein [Streptomyces sp. x-80]|jgi:hypothetical protein|uniref:hypothetical protein n=1 Tax=Streptomyces sp. x-80 TaxID=2789282 RepID=UPI00397F52B2
MSTDARPVLVPVTVEAFVANDKVANVPVARWTPNFHLTAIHRSPEPDPFSNTATTTERGIIVRWRLPANLQSGQVDANTGAVRFPYVPNRWAVIRRVAATGQSVGWVVESDYLDRQKGTVPFLQPYKPDVHDGPSPFRSSLGLTRIGRKLALEDAAQGAGDQAEPFLTSLGPGLTTFADYEPYHTNVFSLHDTDLADAADYDYFVVGWHTNPDAADALRRPAAAHAAPLDAEDPQAELRAQLADLNWALSENDIAALAQIPREQRLSVYCGSLTGVAWDKAGPLPVSARPQSLQQVSLAVGHNTSDALTALLQPAPARQIPGAEPPAPGATGIRGQEPVPPEQELAFEAAQNGLLALAEEPDGPLRITQQLHTNWFSRTPGGQRWLLEPQNAADGTPPDALPLDLVRALAHLNAAQGELEDAERRLHTLQWRLYALWAAGGSPSIPSPLTRDQLTAQLDRAQPDSAAGQTLAQLTEVDQLTADVTALVDQLRVALPAPTNEQAGWNLRTEDRLPFHRATDPVILLRGVCGDQPADPVAQAPRACALAPTQPSQPPSGFPAALGDYPQPIQTAFAHLTDLPEPPAWRQPWAPLFLQWQIEYHYIPYHAADSDQPTWVFDKGRFSCQDAARMEVAQREEDGIQARVISARGRQYLSSLAQFAIKEQIPSLRILLDADNDPDASAAFDDLERWATNASVLTQPLDGMLEQLASRSPASNLAAPPALADLVGHAADYTPDTGPIPPAFTPWAPSEFPHLRAGQFRFTRVQVVDRFGQTLDLITDDPGVESLTPRPSANLLCGPDPNQRVDDAGNLIQLTPRLLQPARLQHELLTATDGIPAELTGDGSPICGWIIPNYLDKALLCYAPDGTLIGDVGLRLPAGGDQPPTVEDAIVTWTPAAGTTTGLEDLPPHLRQALAELVEHRTATDFLGLMEVIDQTLSRTEGAPGDDEKILGQMLGRPLALARTRLRLELDGLPLYDPAWRRMPDICAPGFLETLAQTPTEDGPVEVTGYAWPVRLGNATQVTDGLIGYFRQDAQGDTDYTTFHHTIDAVPTPGTWLGRALANGDYLRPIGEGRDLTVKATPTGRAPGQDPQTPVAGEQILTVLWDPRATLHATTDLLPVTALTLPGRYAQTPLNTLRPYLRTGPLAAITRPQSPDTPTTDGPDAATEALIMPLAGLAQGSWQWNETVRNPDTGTLTAATWPVQPADATALHSDAKPILRSGTLVPVPESTKKGSRP